MQNGSQAHIRGCIEEVTCGDNEALDDQQDDSSDEEEDQKTKAIESAVDIFTIYSDLDENISHFKQEARRYLKGLYKQHARGSHTFAIMCKSPLNTGAVLKNEACTWLNLIYRRLSARPRIRKPWFLGFTRDILKSYLAVTKSFSTTTTTNRNLKRHAHMDGNGKGYVFSVTSLPFMLFYWNGGERTERLFN